MADMERHRLPGLDRLTRLLAAAPAPAAHYRLLDHGEAGRMLEPQKDLARIEARWRGVFPQTKPNLTATQHDFTEMWDEPDRWLDLLEKEPLAWHSFDVLDDVAMAVEVLRSLGTDATVLEPILARGAALLAMNLEPAAPGNGTLPWHSLENRPALRMLAHLAFRALDDMDGAAAGERFIELAERLLALNPNDNHGVRDPLTRAYLARGRPEQVIALTDRFPDDFGAATLNRILALVHLGRRGDALAALHGAAQGHRVAIEMLLADAPKQPRPDSGFGITVGGKEEAWEYRSSHRALWEEGGALQWLDAAWRGIRKGLPRKK
jgi:hypothetical protein